MADELITSLVTRLGYYRVANIKDAISAIAFILLGFLGCMLLLSWTAGHIRFDRAMKEFFLLKLHSHSGMKIIVLNPKYITNFYTILFSFFLVALTLLTRSDKFDYTLYESEKILKRAKIVTWVVICTAIVVMVLGILLSFTVIIPSATFPSPEFKINSRFF